MGNGTSSGGERSTTPPSLESGNWRNALRRHKRTIQTISLVLTILVAVCTLVVYGVKGVFSIHDRVMKDAGESGSKAAIEASKRFQDDYFRPAMQQQLERLAAIEKNLARIDERIARTELALGTAATRPKAVFVVLPVEGVGADAARDIRFGIRQQAGGDDFRIRVAAPEGQSMEEVVKIIDIPDRENPADTIIDCKLRQQQYECVLVLGHVNSTNAHNLCTQYYEHEGIPVVLLGPTFPEITSGAIRRKKRLFLRLMPVDSVQVDAIAKVINSTPRYARVLIYWDESNKIYSEYIARELTKSLESNAKFSNGAVADHPIGPATAKDRPYIKDFERYQPDVVVYVGMTDTAKSLLRGCSELSNVQNMEPNTQLRDIIFTDGCTSASFSEYIRTVRGWNRMILLSPMPPPTRAPQRGIIDFKPLGVIAASLAEELMEGAGARGAITRSSVQLQIADRMTQDDDTIRVREPRFTSPLEVSRPLMSVGFRGSDLSRTVDGDNRSWHYYYYGRRKSGEYFSYVGDTTESVIKFLTTEE